MLLMQGVLIGMNTKHSPTRKHLAFFSVNLILSTALGHGLSNWLYYTYVSSDGMTKAVGALGLQIGVVLAAIASVCALVTHNRWRK